MRIISTTAFVCLSSKHCFNFDNTHDDTRNFSSNYIEYNYGWGFEGYSEYVLPMGLLVILKQLSTVLSEIVRGLNLNLLYTFNLIVIVLLICVACWIEKPSSPFSVLAMLISGHIANLLIGIFMVIRAIQRGNVK